MRAFQLTLCLCLVSVLTALAQYSDAITIETLLKTDTTSMGQKINYPKVQHAEITMYKITMKPGASTGWHKHDIPLFAYVAQGSLTVSSHDGQKKVFTSGMGIAEMIDTYHEGVNAGDVPVVLIAVYLGGDGKPLAVKRESTD